LATTYSRASTHQVATEMPHKTRRPHPWGLAVAVVIVAMVVGAYLAQQMAVALRPGCGTRCTPSPPPPSGGPPLSAPHTYTSSAFGYSLQFGNNLPPPQTDDRSIAWGGSGSSDAILFTGTQTNGQSPAQIVAAVQQDRIPDATSVYQIPGAELGYVPGYGTIYELTATSVNGAETNERIAISAASYGNVAVIKLSASPMAPDTAQEHPNPAQLAPAIAQTSDIIGNTVLWKGMPPQ
jgi:hypothetical protein